MATSTVAKTDLGVSNKTLAASSADTVTFTGMGGYAFQVEVYGDGTDWLYFTVDGTTPTVGSQTALFLPKNPTSRTVTVQNGTKGGDATVLLISASTTGYSVSRV